MHLSYLTLAVHSKEFYKPPCCTRISLYQTLEIFIEMKFLSSKIELYIIVSKLSDYVGRYDIFLELFDLDLWFLLLIRRPYWDFWASLVAQMVRRLPAM